MVPESEEMPEISFMNDSFGFNASFGMDTGTHALCSRMLDCAVAGTPQPVTVAEKANDSDGENRCVVYGAENVHALEGLACRAHVTPASSPASQCKQGSALTSPSRHARGCASPSCAR